VNITEIGAPKGANRKTKRRGLGSGSGHGKTSCRGRKSARKRSGRTTRAGFEGGQMPLVRRVPKKGFNALFKNDYQVVNLESLNKFAANSVVSPIDLKKAGFIGSEKKRIKILGGGKLSRAITIKAHKVTESAKKQLDAVGAKIEFLKEYIK
jgi:large subunit ribosomal protein L15